MAYVPNPQDPTQPTTAQLAGNMAFELQALKGYIQSLVASGTNFAYIGSFRNRLKNGNFNVAQRGTGTFTVGAGAAAYTLDQWILASVGNSSSASQLTGGGFSSTSKNINIAGSAGNTQISLLNRIESFDCQDLIAGTPVTISGFYKVNSLASGVPSLFLATPTVADTWSATTNVGALLPIVISPQIVSTWQFFSRTVVLSADATTGLEVGFQFPTGLQTTQAAFSNIQLEKGSQYTQFEFRPYSVEVDLCQRFYQLLNYNEQGYAQSGVVVSQANALHSYMRVTPTIVVSATTTSGVSGFAITALNTGQVQISATSSSPGAYLMIGSYTASAEL